MEQTLGAEAPYRGLWPSEFQLILNEQNIDFSFFFFFLFASAAYLGCPGRYEFPREDSSLLKVWKSSQDDLTTLSLRELPGGSTGRPG